MTAPPDVLLLTGKQCPYCPTVLKHLQKLQSEGVIGALESYVLEDHPEKAAALGVRSVPWIRIGTFELTGLRSEQELRDWAGKADSADAQPQYLAELLSSGAIEQCLDVIRKDHRVMQDLLRLFVDPDNELNIRIGISAVIESLAGSAALQSAVPQLHELLAHQDARVRGDACYYLALSGTRAGADWIRPLLDDTDSNVREIAADSLAELGDSAAN